MLLPEEQSVGIMFLESEKVKAAAADKSSTGGAVTRSADSGRYEVPVSRVVCSSSAGWWQETETPVTGLNEQTCLPTINKTAGTYYLLSPTSCTC